jgi:hypothetical protein
MSNELIVQEVPSPMLLMKMAIEQNADLDKLEKLMDLQDRWEQKQARKSFLDALSRFQTMVPELKKTKTANVASQKGSFSYKYADLGSIANTIKKPLNECGLSYRWEFQETGDKMKVTCLVSHRDGHTEATSMEGGKDSSGFKNDIQQKGSTHTYLQRYTLIGALGLSTADQDNDGKSTQKKQAITPDEAMDQWKAALKEVKSKIELQSLYIKNRKTVDEDATLQEMFKNRQAELTTTPTNQTAVMP